jgi:ADP-dependent phosphofructokinase/glucokinase
MPIAEMNESVSIEEHALTPEAVEQVIRLTERDDLRDRQEALERERKDLDTRTARLVAAIEAGGEASVLVAKLRELEARDYGRLLERAFRGAGKGVASPAGVEPAFRP